MLTSGLEGRGSRTWCSLEAIFAGHQVLQDDHRLLEVIGVNPLVAQWTRHLTPEVRHDLVIVRAFCINKSNKI